MAAQKEVVPDRNDRVIVKRPGWPNFVIVDFVYNLVCASSPEIGAVESDESAN